MSYTLSLRALGSALPPARPRPFGQPRRARPGLERLEHRVLLSAGDSAANAIAISFRNPSPPAQTAHVSGHLAGPAAVQIYQITLDAGDLVSAAADTSPHGGGLNSHLRVFQAAGAGSVRQIASNDDFRGRDAGLTFQAETAGTYYLGVSGFDNVGYDPLLADSGAGSAHGSFDLRLTRTAAAPLPRLAGSSFRAPATAVRGDAVTVHFTVENRGAVASAPTSLSLVSSADNRFSDTGPALASTPLPAVAAGQAWSGSFTVPLGSPESGRVFLGLQIGSSMPGGPAQGSDWAAVRLLRREADVVPGSASTRETARPVALDSQVSDAALPRAGKDFFKVTLTQPGVLTARVEAGGNPVALTLYDAGGLPIVRSEGQSNGDPGPLVVHALPGNPEDGGTVYYLEVANRGDETAYALTTLFAPSVSTPRAVPVGGGAVSMVRADFNGDGLLDFATGNLTGPDGSPANSVTVFSNNGDGTFQPAFAFSGSVPPEALAVGDFDEDGRLDLAAASQPTTGEGARVVLFLGNGDGTFRPSDPVDTPGGNAMAAGDFDGDGHLDLAFANRISGTVGFLLGDGKGGFGRGTPVSVPGVLSALAAGDLDGDGRLDLAVSDLAANRVTVLLNQGGGAFATAGTFATGEGPFALAAGDLDGDGLLDLATANVRSADVTVALGRGDGTFRPAGNFAVGNGPRELVTADFDGDGRLDLAAANTAANSVTVLMNEGAGRFRGGGPVGVGVRPFALAAGDFDGDGRADLAAANHDTRDVTVLLGRGNGTFPDVGSENRTGQHPVAVVRGDFNGDGRLDLATANRSSGDVTVLLGQGDGTFSNAGAFAAGEGPASLAAGDFNGDGRLDLASADYLAGRVSVFLGNGAGQFQPGGSSTAGVRPTALVADDFDGDGNLDLAATDSVSNQVVLLLGRGDGTVRTTRAFPVGGIDPRALVAGDFDGDGHLDLAAANYYSRDVSVLLGTGRGSFSPATATPLGHLPAALVAGDFDGDTRLDLAFATRYYDRVAVLLNTGRGSFGSETTYDLGTVVSSLVAGDFDGDGRLDLAAVEKQHSYTFAPANRVTLLLGDGGGDFSPTGSFGVGDGPFAAVAGDFDGDGRLDLATANYVSSAVTALLGTGGGFVSPALAPGLVRSTPLVARLTGGAALDALVLTQTGQIQFRRGLADRPGAFAPPAVLNPDPRFAARDLALVRTAGGGYLLAALGASSFPSFSGVRVPRVTFYRPSADGTFAVVAGVDLPPGFLPARLASADLTGNGLGDLVVTAAGADRVFVVRQTAPGVFGPAAAHLAGLNPSAIAVADLDRDSRLDVVVTNRFSGQVSVLHNQGAGDLSPAQRFRAGTGLYGLTAVNGASAVESLEGTSDVVLGSFDGDAAADAVVLNRGTRSFSLLTGNGTGGFLNPHPERTVSLGVSPTAAVAGQFTTGDTDLDLAVLSTESNTLLVFKGDGRGGFTPVFTAGAGNQPTGISVADVSRPGGGGPDGIEDLLIGNAYGDLLIVTGAGDGTFSPYRRADQAVSLAVATSAGSSRRTFFFSNQGGDRLAYRPAPGGTAVVSSPTVFQDRTAGIQAPGPQAAVTVLGTRYLLVANSGANELLSYTLDANGRPVQASRRPYFTGTNPVSITTAAGATDLNGDNIPDVVVANEGSNDVSVFLGQLTDGRWTLAYRPRQTSGGLGPTSVAIADVTGAGGSGRPDGVPDLLVSNGLSDAVSLLASRGNGYFVNQIIPAAPALNTGRSPRQVLVGNFDRTGGLDLVTVNRGSNDVTLIANFMTRPVTSVVTSGGTLPVAAVAIAGRGGSDLLVANAGDGTIELLHGTAAGFRVADTMSHPELPHPSDLVLVAAGNGLEVYGTDASREIAVLLGVFGAPVPPPHSPDFFPRSPGFEAGLEIGGEGLFEGTRQEGFASAPAGAATEEPTLLVFPAGFVARLLEAATNLLDADPGGDADETEPEDGAEGTPPRARAADILLLNLAEPNDPGADPQEGPPAEGEDDDENGAPPQDPPDGPGQKTSGDAQKQPADGHPSALPSGPSEGPSAQERSGEPAREGPVDPVRSVPAGAETSNDLPAAVIAALLTLLPRAAPRPRPTGRKETSPLRII